MVRKNDKTTYKTGVKALENLHSYLLNRISHRYNKSIHKELGKIGLTTITTRVLVSLKVFGGLSVSELCVHAIAEQPTMSKALKRLSSEGLVESYADAEDSRIRMVRLTDAGEKTYTQIWPVIADQNKAMMDGISTADQDIARRVLTKMLDNIRVNRF